MKIWALITLTLVSLTINAEPITYKFTGHITSLGDSWAGGYPYDPGFRDWWPELGDPYSGTVTVDEDALIYDATSCIAGPICGGLVSFEMILGGGSVSFQKGNGTGIEAYGSSLYNFTAWATSFRGDGAFYDSFSFDSTGFQAVDNEYWDSIAGNADSFVRVPEPPTLALLIGSLLAIGFRKNYQRL
ncbi:PEP-CTERM sorting domain-containing protein [Marinobacter subterrani]|uniref:PEP-CTERM protein-sorting domain n=1 Tax=Marinobacter subterrani TaxID=1658765 RepID=A0A0J7J9V2_9GAMM|nr:PEP-CTERM sorting domain-containing protein [Marinobacter subterrani]KMQ74661.1 PEP-CTERM protein-sorting domain [Marinobacter subterrani]